MDRGLRLRVGLWGFVDGLRHFLELSLRTFGEFGDGVVGLVDGGPGAFCWCESISNSFLVCGVSAVSDLGCSEVVRYKIWQMTEVVLLQCCSNFAYCARRKCNHA